MAWVCSIFPDTTPRHTITNENTHENKKKHTHEESKCRRKKREITDRKRMNERTRENDIDSHENMATCCIWMYLRMSFAT